MKIPNHIAKQEFEEIIDIEHESLIVKPCAYEGTDILVHEDGLCIHCDYKRVKEQEKDLDWSVSTEWWDFYELWFRKNKELNTVR